MFFIRLFLVNIWERKSGVTVLVSSQTAVKGGHGFEIAVRMDNLFVCTRDQACFRLFFFYVFDIANTQIQT